MTARSPWPVDHPNRTLCALPHKPRAAHCSSVYTMADRELSPQWEKLLEEQFAARAALDLANSKISAL